VVKNSLQKSKKHKKCKISNSSITASHPPRNDDFAYEQMTEWGGHYDRVIKIEELNYFLKTEKS
jgi:hypothetical protein